MELNRQGQKGGGAGYGQGDEEGKWDAGSGRDHESDFRKGERRLCEKAASDPAAPVKYRPLYRCGDTGHSGKRKSMLTAMTHRSAYVHVCKRVCVSALSMGFVSIMHVLLFATGMCSSACLRECRMWGK